MVVAPYVDIIVDSPDFAAASAVAFLDFLPKDAKLSASSTSLRPSRRASAHTGPVGEPTRLIRAFNQSSEIYQAEVSTSCNAELRRVVIRSR